MDAAGGDAGSEGGAGGATVIFAEIFAGIRGASVAWASLGWECAWVSETDPFASAVAEHHHDTPNLGDIRAITKDNAAAIDLLVGGPPCQDFSVAGKRAGMDGDRGGMVWEYLRVADALRPRWLVFENVPGLLSSNGGRDFGAVLGAMAERGYMGCYRVLDLEYWRVPQRRRRVFIVGYLGDWRPAAAVLLERESLSGNSPPGREEGEGVARPLASRTGNYSQDESKETFVTHQVVGPLTAEAGTDRKHGASGISSLQQFLSGHIQPVAFAQNQRQEVRELGAAGALSSIRRGDAKNETLLAFSCKDSGQEAGEQSPTLRAMPHDQSHPNAGGQVAVVFEPRFARNDRGAPSEVCPPLKARSGEDGRGDSAPATVTALGVRRLTPRECERPQGFPDDYTQIPWRGKPRERCPDGPRYRVLGNAFPVPVVRWIGERIAMVDAML